MWFKTNPSLNYFVMERTLASKAATKSVDGFNREHLGFWDCFVVGTGDVPINTKKWKAAATKEPPKDGIKSFAVKYAVDGSCAAIAVCVKAKNTYHVEIVVLERTATLE